MSLWNDLTPPVLYPDAVATDAGWADPLTGELLVAISGLSTFKTGAAQIVGMGLYNGKSDYTTNQSLGLPTVYGVGDKIIVEVVFSEPVTWTGNDPQLTATINTNSRTFAYYLVPTELKRYTMDKVMSVTVGSGGTNYQVGDVVTFTGGGGESAKGIVSSVGASNAITAISMTSNGASYTSVPTAVVSTGYVKSLAVSGTGNHLYQDGDVLSFTTAGSTTQATGYIVTDGSHTPATPANGYKGVGNVSKAVLTSGGVGYTSNPTVTITSLAGSGNTVTATTSYGAGATLTPVIGTVANGKGTNRIMFAYTVASNETATSDQITFTSPIGSSGTTTWANVDSALGTGATATATIVSGVTSYTVTTPGSGYTSAPKVTVSGDGTGATAVAVLDKAVGAVNGGTGGAGYRTAPVVTVGAGNATVTAVLGTTGIICDVTIGGTADSGIVDGAALTVVGGTGSGFAGTVNVTAGDITGVTITNAGSYTVVPTSLTCTGLTHRTLTPVLGKPIASYTIGGTNTGYTTAPTLSVATPTATSGTTTAGAGVTLRSIVATPTASLTALQTVKSVGVVTEGSGYTAATVAFTGGGGTNAAATAAVSGEVDSVTITNGGTGYYVAPTVTFAGGTSGTTATGTATIDDRGHVIAVTNNSTLSSVTVSGTSNLLYVDGEVLSLTGGAQAHLSVVNTVTTNSLNGLETITAQTVSVVIDNAGSGVTPVVTYPLPGRGSGLTFTPVLTGLSSGTGYTTAPTVSFTPVAETPTITFPVTQFVSSVTISGTGQGYVGGEALVFSTGAGAGYIVVDNGSLTGNVGNIVGVVITNSGSYASAPTITVAPPVTWNSALTYSVGQVVLYSGTRYVSKLSGNLNQQPNTATTYWSSLTNNTLTAVMGSTIVGSATVNGVSPTITSAVITQDRFGDTITQTTFNTGDWFTVSFVCSAPVTVVNGSGATVALVLTSGGKTATYFNQTKNGSGNSVLHFAYQVQSTDASAASSFSVTSPVILAAGTTIEDAAGNNLTLSFTPPTTTGVVIN